MESSVNEIQVQIGFVRPDQKVIMAGERIFFQVGLNEDVPGAFFDQALEPEQPVEAEKLLVRLVEGPADNEQICDGVTDFRNRRGLASVHRLFDKPGKHKLRLRLVAIHPDRPWQTQSVGSLPLEIEVARALGIGALAGGALPNPTPPDPMAGTRRVDDTRVFALAATSSGREYTLTGGWQDLPGYETANLPLTESDLEGLLTGCLDRLNKESVGYETLFGRGVEKTPKIDGARRAQICRIARVGWKLYDQVLMRDLVAGDPDYRARLVQAISSLPERTRIRIRGNDLALPWNVIYDREPPAEDCFTRADLDGFWGYRYRIHGVAPSPIGLRNLLPPERRLCAWIDPSPGGSWNEVLNEIAREHRKAILDLCSSDGRCFAQVFPLRPEHSESQDFDAKTQLAETIAAAEASNLIYFFCHGRGTERRIAGGRLSREPASLVLTARHHTNVLERRDLKAWRRRSGFQRLTPIVFLNCCESAKIDPLSVNNLAEGFIAALHARAVVGCCWMVPGRFAHEFAHDLLSEFLKEARPLCLGDALFEVRRIRLESFNAFGLVYSMTGDSQVKVGSAGPILDALDLQ